MSNRRQAVDSRGSVGLIVKGDARLIGFWIFALSRTLVWLGKVCLRGFEVDLHLHTTLVSPRTVLLYPNQQTTTAPLRKETHPNVKAGDNQ